MPHHSPNSAHRQLSAPFITGLVLASAMLGSPACGPRERPTSLATLAMLQQHTNATDYVGISNDLDRYTTPCLLELDDLACWRLVREHYARMLRELDQAPSSEAGPALDALLRDSIPYRANLRTDRGGLGSPRLFLHAVCSERSRELRSFTPICPKNARFTHIELCP